MRSKTMGDKAFDKTIIPAKRDIMFKILFVRNKDLLCGFLEAALGIKIDSADDIVITNTELIPDYSDSRSGRLDIKAVIGGTNVNIEIQLINRRFFRERILYYWAKLYSDDLKKGDSYGKLKKSISISVLDFRMFEGKEFHSRFNIIERTRGEIFSDKLDIHFFELPKIYDYIGENGEKLSSAEDILLWLKLLDSDTQEELDMITNSTSNSLIQKGSRRIAELSEDEKVRELIRQYDKWDYDRGAELADAREDGRNEGRIEGIKEGRNEGIEFGRADERRIIMENLRKSGMSDEQIKKAMYRGEN